MQKTVKHLLDKCTTEEEVDKELKLFRQEIQTKTEEEKKDVRNITSSKLKESP